jgi:hypothetical protein
MKLLLLPLLLLAACATPVPETVSRPAPVVIYQAVQDVTSCIKDPDTPWCQSECNFSDQEWCK